MESRTEDSILENFTQLTTEDKTLLEAFDNVKNKNDLVDILINFATHDPQCLFRLAENKKSFREFCETNMRFNLALIKMKCIPKGYPQQFIKSEHSKEKCSPFTIFMGALLWTEYEKLDSKKSEAAIFFLNMACEKGIYNALLKRMKIDLEQLKKDDENLVLYYKILKDADRISNLYWSLGDINAGNILLDVANCCLHSPSGKIAFDRFIINGASANRLEAKTEQEIPLSVEILESAIKYFCAAELLVNFPESKNLKNAVLQEKSLFAGFEKYCTDWESAHALILNTLDKKFHMPTPQTFFQKTFEKAKADFKTHHPEVKKALKP